MCVMARGARLYLPFILCLVSSVKNGYSSNCTQSFVRIETNFIKSVTQEIRLTNSTIRHITRHYWELQLAVPSREERQEYLENLLNLFSLVHRLTKEWPTVLALIRTTSKYSEDYLRYLHFPISTDELWTSGVTGLVRVQEVYNISAETLASGQLEGTHPRANLTGADCFGIALYYYKLKHYERAVEWLVAALQRTQQVQSVSRQTILEYLHLAQCFKGDLRGSANTHVSLRHEYPAFSPSQELLADYSTSANQSCREISDSVKAALYDVEESPHYVENTRGLCRKDEYRSPNDKRLRCRLLHYNQPHLRIRPFKMEELNIDPPLLKVYDVIFDSEIEHLKSMFHNRTRHALTDYSSQNDHYHDTQYNTWIREYDDEAAEYNDPVAQKITRRSGRITNLDLSDAESTMLASYGLAGEIKLHSDCGKDEKLLADPDSEGDMLTLMYYLNDVEEGGYTVYPKINIAVVPDKGAAVMWYNRYPDLSRVYTISHSGCPVMRGSKWIITKWFHVRGQDFPKCVPGKERSYKYYYM